MFKEDFHIPQQGEKRPRGRPRGKLPGYGLKKRGSITNDPLLYLADELTWNCTCGQWGIQIGKECKCKTS